MTFFDEDMNTHDVTMQELQLAAQEHYNYSLINEPRPELYAEPVSAEEVHAAFFG